MAVGGQRLMTREWPTRLGGLGRGLGRTLGSRYWLLLPIVSMILLLLFLPLALIAHTSLSSGSDSYGRVLGSPLLEPIVVNTVFISTITAVLAVVLAYICAAAAWRSGPLLRAIIFAFVLLPFWTGVLVKNFAWAVLMQDNGPISDLSQWMGFGSVSLLHSRTAVIIGMVHYVLPYAVLPIFAVMVGIDQKLEQAATSLGASRRRATWHIVLPLTLPGVYAAALLVFIISTGFFITPVVLGGPSDQMIPNLVEYYARGLVDFGAASVLAMLVVIVVSFLVVVYQRLPKEGQYGRA